MSGRYALAVVVATAAAACGAPQASPEAAEAMATQASSAIIRRALIRGEDAMTGEPVVDVEMRYNPAACECPPFEIRLYGAWIRSGLEATRDSDSGVASVLGAPLNEGAAARLQIATRPVDTLLAGGWTYPVWEVLTITPAREVYQ